MDLFDVDHYLRLGSDKYREYSNFFWLLLLLLLVPFYCAIQLGTKETEGKYKEKIELEGFAIKVDYYIESCELKLRNYEDDEYYLVTIKQEIFDNIDQLQPEQLVRIIGYIPNISHKQDVVALKVKIL